MEKLRKSVKYIPSFEVKQNFEKKLDLAHKTFKEEIKKTKNKSKEAGRKLGEKMGKQEGIRIGEKKGKLEIAQSMLKNGYALEDIMLLTGLSASDIQDLS